MIHSATDAIAVTARECGDGRARHHTTARIATAFAAAVVNSCTSTLRNFKRAPLQGTRRNGACTCVRIGRRCRGCSRRDRVREQQRTERTQGVVGGITISNGICSTDTAVSAIHTNAKLQTKTQLAASIGGRDALALVKCLAGRFVDTHLLPVCVETRGGALKVRKRIGVSALS